MDGLARRRRMGSVRGGDRPTRRPRVFGTDAAVEDLGDGLFELRFSLGPTARRITYRFTKDGRVVLLITFRKQRNNERTEIARAAKVAGSCAQRNP